MAALATNPIGEVRTMLRDVSMLGGTAGAAAWRSSGTTSAVSATAATNRPRTPGEVHPQY
ncbi:hypothetical protein ACWCOW_33195 [Streptomyces sp. NPDC001939]|uniref:hypothetical protein n=1 Tax=unclassified Streptomyces TaxID=2593676 RepID=UPI0033FBE4C0